MCEKKNAFLSPHHPSQQTSYVSQTHHICCFSPCPPSHLGLFISKDCTHITKPSASQKHEPDRITAVPYLSLAKTGKGSCREARAYSSITPTTEIPRTSSMAMVSPRLQLDIDRRVRAAYSLDIDRGLCGDTYRSSSVPAALRHHRTGEPNRAVTAPAGYRGRRGSTARARLTSLAKHVRTARSESPPTMQYGQEERGERNPSTTEPRTPTAASVADVEAPLTSEDSLSGTGAGVYTSLKSSPVAAADVPEKAGSREKEGTVSSGFGAPKLMELMEERDRAVHLCLQVPPMTLALYVDRLKIGHILTDGCDYRVQTSASS